MRYEIDAWLEEGEPRLRILDADSGTVRMAWDSDAEHGRDPALKALFRELMLLSALQRLR